MDDALKTHSLAIGDLLISKWTGCIYEVTGLNTKGVTLRSSGGRKVSISHHDPCLDLKLHERGVDRV